MHALLQYYPYKTGRKYADIGGIIEDIIKPKGYRSVKEFCGHGYAASY